MFGISVINKIFNSKMITKKYSLITFLFIFIYLASCGQQVMKDEVLVSKSIERVGSLDEDLFEIISVDPPNGSYNVNKVIRIKFTFNKELREYGTGSQGDCNKQVFKISTDKNFNGKTVLI